MYGTHRTVWHLGKTNPAGPGDARALDGNPGALPVRSEKRVGRVKARILQRAPQPSGMFRVPGNSIHQMGAGQPADSGHGAPQRRARLLPAFVQNVQQPDHHAESDGGAGKQA
jgi:hypothetical protein